MGQREGETYFFSLKRDTFWQISKLFLSVHIIAITAPFDFTVF